MKLPSLSYDLLKAIGVPLFKLYFRLESINAKNIPAKGGVIIVANHSSFIDALFIAATVPRKIGFMMLQSFYKKPVLNWFCRDITCIPVPDNESGHQALRRAIEYLKEGNTLSIFPEGGRSDDGKLKEAKTGTAFIALKTGIPVIPAGIIGNFKAYSKHHLVPRPYKITVRYGKPMVFEKKNKITRNELNSTTQLIMEKIKGLM
ncbi:MAG: hypothetical protein A3C43_09115 [Candidatus Schekmanbacteria bacterium RIFCSPHIGHO2_02_FULL_38_11]|uniref:Phospholipid/glycerol acyltransferase domain-containing protein n=1 Tax=Candidatus Schekmanbacteria bacterium RIFCSPLOWO2_12_FULL_38_15 TaxID=1817883 RepID=A0A1F7SKN5_9BACT|nr:MAG: hypothetical protein A2043_02130 [Candidatus Schekmanbacteria bacterium GWA2_38_9]OGL48676.1 MAG: hypothetical protein A3H37_04350 [Candidatus Schekmanbacteria bacterium RIFCSPLOWO2_02_FULL_38_14]OGL49179.1 MAG: hypothetical protein A3C43_09115 [Candidatus Schekmanbacteria bacterium RIFCSPHIGHO2_02_FULL_38_11]OGL54331.1 MAG: hypothetical protein A3G31_12035 [Candidatus Schekmanbacteria bacterium RIFCSPLOWO2_12_FULL_38_15]